MTRVNWNDIVRVQIEKIGKKFIESPYLYIYEADIQARLFACLYEAIKTHPNYNKKECFISEKPWIDQQETSVLHTQIAIPGESKKNHLDIGIWNYDELVTGDYGQKQVDIGIEIKYSFYTHKKNTESDPLGYLDELHKLSNYMRNNKLFHGYALLFLPAYKQNSIPKLIEFYKEKFPIPLNNRLYSYIFFSSDIYKNYEKL